MKCFLFCLFFPLLTFSQEAPKGTNLIKVKGVSFKEVAETLLDQGYTFMKIDSNFNTITTDPKDNSRRTSGMIQINIRVKDSVAFITGYCGWTAGDFTDNPGYTGDKLLDVALGGKGEIRNVGMKRSILKDSFGAIDKFAKSLGGKIEYVVNK